MRVYGIYAGTWAHAWRSEDTLQNQPPSSTFTWVTGPQARLASTYTCLAISSAPRLAFYFLVLASFPLRSLFCSWSRAREPHSNEDFWLGTHRSHLPWSVNVFQAWRSCTRFLWLLSLKLLTFLWATWPITSHGHGRGRSNVTTLSQVEQWAIKRRTLKPFWV